MTNFHQLFLLCALALSYCLSWRKKFTSPDIQNEIISLLSNSILHKVVENLQSKYFSIMVDETTDVSNSEQVVMVLCWVDETLSVHEDFIGLYKTESTTASTLVQLINDVLLRCNLSISYVAVNAMTELV
jgi:hypothetical protein